MKKIALWCLLLCFLIVVSGCSSAIKTTNIEAPKRISTIDEAKIEQNPNAVEKSDNVNGMRYNITLSDFSDKYNEMLKEMGNLDMINKGAWIKKGEPKSDTNGVEIQYYYYDANKISFTATVETKTNKIMNIGLGTTMSHFVSIENNKNYSDVILMKSGVMAAAVTGCPIEMVNTFQDVFYRTTNEDINELWYEGNVFCLSTIEDKGDSERSTMLFRVFPVTEKLKNEWNMTEYEEYISLNE